MFGAICPLNYIIIYFTKFQKKKKKWNIIKKETIYTNQIYPPPNPLGDSQPQNKVKKSHFENKDHLNKPKNPTHRGYDKVAHTDLNDKSNIDLKKNKRNLMLFIYN